MRTNPRSKNVPHLFPDVSFRLLPKIFVILSLMLWLYILSSMKFYFSNPFLRGSVQSMDHQQKLQHISESNRLRPYVHNSRHLSYEYEHAIIVAGHAVMRLSNQNIAAQEDSGWYLLSYQKGQGFPGIISSHILEGVKRLKMDPRSLLIFSGGQTRKDVGPLSEAASYYYLAQDQQWLRGLESRTFLEEYARDSFENLLFSLCRFREVSGQYPKRITVIGFDFKSKRFNNLHRLAISFPSNNFTYIGLRPNHRNFDHKKAMEGENDVLLAYSKDMYGCSSSLADKRAIRNPFYRTIPYPIACPEIKDLLEWCGPNIFDSPLPWQVNATDEDNISYRRKTLTNLMPT